MPRFGAPNWAQYYDEVVDRHGPLLTDAVGRRLISVWTPTHGRVARHGPRTWGSREPILLVFEELQLEFTWNRESRSVTRAEADTTAMALTGRRGDEDWCMLGDETDDPAVLVTLAGQRLWAVDVLDVDCEETALGFAFSRSYVTMNSTCCCTLLLTCVPQQSRRLRLAQTGPTRDGYPPTAVTAPRGQ